MLVLILASISSTLFYLQENPSTDYFENNCLSFGDEDTDPEQSCNFKPSPGKLMKTVDSVYQGVPTREDCKNLCINANFR